MTDKITSKKPSPEKPEDKKDNNIKKPEEFGGTKGPEPTRYGDWEHNGRCSDF